MRATGVILVILGYKGMFSPKLIIAIRAEIPIEKATGTPTANRKMNNANRIKSATKNFSLKFL